MADDKYKKIFSRNLKHYLILNNKTQIDLVNDLKISSSTVSNWCTGQKLPRMDKIQMLADYLSINKSDLIEDKASLSNVNKKATNTMSLKHQEILSKYDRLDEHSKEIIDFILNKEFEKIVENKSSNKLKNDNNVEFSKDNNIDLENTNISTFPYVMQNEVFEDNLYVEDTKKISSQ